MHTFRPVWIKFDIEYFVNVVKIDAVKGILCLMMKMQIFPHLLRFFARFG